MQNQPNENVHSFFTFACAATGRTVQEVERTSPAFKDNSPNPLPKQNNNSNDNITFRRKDTIEGPILDYPPNFSNKDKKGQPSTMRQESLRMSFGEQKPLRDERMNTESNYSDKGVVMTEKSVRDSGSIGRQSGNGILKQLSETRDSLEREQSVTIEVNSKSVTILQQDGLTVNSNRYDNSTNNNSNQNVDSRENIRSDRVTFQDEAYSSSPTRSNNERSRQRIKRKANSRSEDRRAKDINKDAERKIKAILSNYDIGVPREGFLRWGYKYKTNGPYDVTPEKYLADGLSRRDCLNNSALNHHTRFWRIEKTMQELMDNSTVSRKDPKEVAYSLSPLKTRTPHRIQKNVSQTEQSPAREGHELGYKFIGSQYVRENMSSRSPSRQLEAHSRSDIGEQSTITEQSALPYINSKPSHRRAESSIQDTSTGDLHDRNIKLNHRRAESSIPETSTGDLAGHRAIINEPKEDITESPTRSNSLRANAQYGYRATTVGKLTPIKNLARIDGGATPHLFVTTHHSFTSKSGVDTKSGVSLIVTPSREESHAELLEENHSVSQQKDAITPSNGRNTSPFLLGVVEEPGDVYDQHMTNVTETTFRRTFRGTSRSRGDEREKINSESLVRNVYRVRPVGQEIIEPSAQVNEAPRSSRKIIENVSKARRNSGDYTSLLDHRSCGFTKARRPVKGRIDFESPGPKYDLSAYKSIVKPSKGFLTEDDLLKMARFETDIKSANRSFRTGRDGDMGNNKGAQPVMIKHEERRNKSNGPKGAYFGTTQRFGAWNSKADIPGPGEYNMPDIKSKNAIQFGKEKKGFGANFPASQQDLKV